MKKIILLLFLIFIIGCKNQVPDFEFQYDDDNVTEEQFIKEGRQANKEEAKAPVPQKGTIAFSAETKKTLEVLDAPVEVELKTKGNLSFLIDGKKVTGNGKGNLEVKLFSDIGIAECSGKKNIPLEFEIKGDYDPATNLIVFKSHTIKPETATMDLKCPYDFGADLTYELPIPVIFFAGTTKAGSSNLLLQEGDVIKKIKHPIPEWDLDIEVEWKFTISLATDFDFDMEVDPAIVEVTQGGTATPEVTVKHIAGNGNVALTVTSWDTINAFLTNTQVTPTETTTLTLETSCDTKPDSYLFTVRAETVGKIQTFRTSTDAVTLVVTENPSC